jgi:hypothetical protein
VPIMHFLRGSVYCSHPSLGPAHAASVQSGFDQRTDPAGVAPQVLTLAH